jgi:hypothetical protein
MRNKIVLVGAAAALAVLVSTTLVLADGSDRATKAPSEPPVSGTAKGSCGMAYQSTVRDTAYWPTTIDTTTFAISWATLNKGCRGPVVGTFGAEVRSDAGYLYVAAKAVCRRTGGYPRACTPGSTVWAEPSTGSGSAYYIQASSETSRAGHGVQFLWPNLRPGIWKLSVLPQTDGTNGIFGYRTWVVNAYKA